MKTNYTVSELLAMQSKCLDDAETYMDSAQWLKEQAEQSRSLKRMALNMESIRHFNISIDSMRKAALCAEFC